MSHLIRRRDLIAIAAGISSLPLCGMFAARAQQRPVIGYLAATTAIQSSALTSRAAFLEGLSEQGFVYNRNVDILYRYAESSYDRLPALAEDLVRRRVAIIVAVGNTAAVLAAGSATKTIPIVFANGADPVKQGLVASLNHPGGNATGVSFLTVALIAKRLELLHEVTPSVSSVAFLVNPTNPTAESQIAEAEDAARTLGLHLTILNASTPEQINTAFARLAQAPIRALLTAADVFFVSQRDQLAALASSHSVPAIYHAREIVDAGGLVSYGANFYPGYRVAGTYVGRILKGEKPADLPVQQSTRIEMVLNLKTARALGIEVPTATLLRATEVIE